MPKRGSCKCGSWWRWNTSVNTSILVGKLKDLSEIPSCAFIPRSARLSHHEDEPQTRVGTLQLLISADLARGHQNCPCYSTRVAITAEGSRP